MDAFIYRDTIDKEIMRQLNPTFWRTCGVLAGRTRLSLLRQVFDNPGQNVSQMAATVNIGEPYASQELRRLQSRGLLRRYRKGLSVFFRPIPDPQVPSAAPLLKALKAALAVSPERDVDIIRIAKALAHNRRIEIARELMRSPRNTVELSARTRIKPAPLQRHLQLLIAGGFVRREGKLRVFQPAPHPFNQVLAKWIG